MRPEIAHRALPFASRRAGFTLTEILIVIALIVLLLALAMPAFNFITGGRSVDAAANAISSLLARARTEAVGMQEIRGVMFYIDPKSGRQSMVLVKETIYKSTDHGAVQVYLDASDSDHIALPRGIGIQLARDNEGGAADRYIGFNQYLSSPKTIPVGGAILFDGSGRLTSKTYGFRMNVPNSAGSGTVQTSMSRLLLPDATSVQPDFYPIPSVGPTNPPTSSLGLLLFDHEVASSRFGERYYEDPLYGGGAESGEEAWLVSESTAVLINRYNGTLVKGE